MTRKELVSSIQERTKGVKLTAKTADAVLSATLDAVTAALAAGDKVQLVGFGTFEAKKRPARTSRNPQTGKTIDVAAKTVPVFKAGAKLKDAVSKAG